MVTMSYQNQFWTISTNREIALTSLFSKNYKNLQKIFKKKLKNFKKNLKFLKKLQKILKKIKYF